MNVAVITDGVVENIIVADSVEIAEEVTGKTCVEYTDEQPAHIGLGYVGGEFEQPPAPTLDEEPPAEDPTPTE